MFSRSADEIVVAKEVKVTPTPDIVMALSFLIPEETTFK